MRLGKMMFAATLVLVSVPAWSAPFAANCHRDTSDRMSSDYNMVTGNYDHEVIPGVHARLRLDINLDAGTAQWSEAAGPTYFWKNGTTVRWSSDGSPGRQFVATNGRFVWFGVDHFADDQRPTWTEKYSLDLESGTLVEPNHRSWDCEKAVNKFQ